MSQQIDLGTAASVIASFAPTSAQLGKANKLAANAMRQALRANLSAQQDIGGQAFTARKQSTYKTRRGKVLRANPKMLLGFARLIAAQGDATSASVSLKGRAAGLARVHNEGLTVKHRSGSTYKMTKREFFGWNSAMAEAAMAAVINNLTWKQA